MLNKKTPITWILSAYFAMGFPFIFIAQVSSVMYKNLGINDAQITFWTGLLILPWSLKPFWSPFLEIFRYKKYIVVTAQFIVAWTFIFVALSLPLNDFFKYSIALLAIVAFMGSTNDIATDGLYINVLDSKTQAKYIGWQGAFYNIAKIIASGPLIYLAGSLQNQLGAVKAWEVTMVVFAVLMFVLSLYHLLVLPKEAANNLQDKSFKQSLSVFKDVVVTFFKKKHIIWFIVFIIFYRFAEGFAIKIAPLFSISAVSAGGLGLSTEQYSLIYGTFGTAAFVFGSIGGGYFIAKTGLRNSRMVLVSCFNIPFAVYAYLAFTQTGNYYIISSCVVLEYFGYGFGFVGLILFMMQQVAPGKYKMAHYAFATSIMNLGFMFPSMLSGYFSDLLGYKWFFIGVLFATIPAFLVTYFVPYRYSDNKIDSKS